MTQITDEMVERSIAAVVNDLLHGKAHGARVRGASPDNFNIDGHVDLRSVVRVTLTAALEGSVAVPALQPMATAPKDGSRIYAQLKNPIPNDREDLRRWDGVPFIARHPGICEDGFDIGWNFAAPVGHGGFPDDWFEGWSPLPRQECSGEAG